MTAIYQPSRNRVNSIDLLRGLVMIIMALDHTRDFFHIGAISDQDPLDFSTTSPLLFLTRWITHYCAPIFVFLSGTSIFLFSSKGKTKKQVSFFLLTRGLWLMALEVLVVSWLWNFDYSFAGLQVIWAIGICMVVFSALIFLPRTVLFGLGVVIVCGHNLLDNVRTSGHGVTDFLWAIVHQPNGFELTKHYQVFVAYPFLSWLGLMLLGYCLGSLYKEGYDAKARRKILLYTGIGLILLYILIRWINVYGDMQRWHVQKTTIFSILDFINPTKYPPSLLYMCMTIGPGLILLSLFERISNPFSKKIIIYGRVPFFYYIMHLFLIHSFSWIAFFLSGHGWNNLDFIHFRFGSLPFGWGFPLWVVYLVWITAIIILYFPSRWYNNYKATHKQWWLSYL